MRQKSFYLTLGFIMLIAVPAFVSVAIRPESARAFDGESYAIRGGTVVTVTGATIPKGVIIIRNGLIAAVGADIPVPGDARIIEAAGMTIYPGLFDAYSNYGARPAPTPPASRAEALAQPTAVPATLGLLPEVTIVDQLQITENTFDQQRSAGITTALTGPNAGIFQGQSALINLGAESAEKLILKAPFSLNVGFNSARGGYPNSLMGVFSFLRQSLIDARYYQEEWARYQRAPRGAERPPINKSLAALQPVINGEMPVVFNTGTVREMKRAIGLAEEFKLKYLLSGATESYQIADYLKSKQATVLLSLSFPQRPPGLEDPESELLRVLKVRAEAPKSAATLYKAGVKFAFSSGTLTRPQDYLVNAARAIEAGLPPDVALKALTIYPAEIFGVSEQLGSIERGKIANLILATGDLFNKETKVKNVFIDGKLYDIKPPDPARPGPGGRGPRGGPPVAAPETWSLTINSPQGPLPGTLTIRPDGGSLRGEIDTQFGTVPISNASLKGDELNFDFTVEVQGQSMPVSAKGRIAGDAINGTMETAGQSFVFNGTRKPSRQQ